MDQKKKFLTKQTVDFAKWYNEIVIKAELADYSPVRGCMVIRPYGWSIWENMQQALDGMIKEAEVENAYFPLFIPMSYLQKEKEHVKGFSPQLAVVTHGGGKKLDEPLVVRPTSETIMYRMYANWIQSYRDLPLKINQWANVVRWELRTYLFLRTMEFLWQEGHTAHATHEEASEEMMRAVLMYKKFYRDYLAIEPFVGEKSETERFAGGLHTFATEALVKDGKFVQAATSHDLGQNFSKVFEIQFQDEDKKVKNVWQTSWGLSTRALGTMIMAHGDDNGLVLPPKIAPIQIVIVPITGKTKDKDLKEYAEKVKSLLVGIRAKIDDRDKVTPGFKFNEWEMKGVPLRIEIGDREVKEEKVTVVSRLTGEKESLGLAQIKELKGMLDQVQQDLLKRHQKFTKGNTHKIDSWSEFEKAMKEKKGALLAFWCGDKKCEAGIKEKTRATTRVLPLNQKETKGKCVHCNKETSQQWVFGKGY